MRIALAVFLFCVAACHDHEHNDYDTFQACYIEHTVEESLSVQQAIVVCCLDHPIGGDAEPCGATAAECTTYLTANVTGPTAAEVQASCTEYITQKGM